MKDTRVYRSTDIGSDHYLVCTTVKLERNIIEQVNEWQATLNPHFIDFKRRSALSTETACGQS